VYPWCARKGNDDMEIEPSHNEALKNVCKVKEILKECISIGQSLAIFESLETAIKLLDKTEEILAKGH
jgi:SpoU rRNA methylase family enzyme